jgi:cytochrome b
MKLAAALVMGDTSWGVVPAEQKRFDTFPKMCSAVHYIKRAVEVSR